jgi:energy-coupling factor transporter ATP-binding protein EcfA2
MSGSNYLTLARASGTLSGGESQRIRLASQIGSGLTGVLYVLDEPSIGLHQRDNARLLETLKRLRDLGNTVIVVEHDEDAIRRRLRARHRPRRRHPWRPYRRRRARRRHHEQSELADRQISHRRIAVPIPERRPPNHRRTIKVVNARGNNLKNVSAEIPLGLFTCVTGVSGGGKSTLLIDTLYKALAQAQRRQRGPGPARPHRGPRAPRQDHRHRPVADRPHAALEPGDLYRRVHADPRMVRRPARGQGARLRARPLLVQRQGRPLRGLPGRRRHQDRDALPARRLRHLRRLQGQALQPRDAGSAVQGQVDRRRARHDGRGRRRLLQGGAAGARDLADCCTASASTTSMSASRRRRCPAARPSASNSPRNCQARHRPHALHPGRADHRPAFPRRGKKLLEVLHELVVAGQHRGGDRAQSRSHQDRRLGHRPRPRRRRRRRRNRRLGPAGRYRQGEAQLYGASS